MTQSTNQRPVKPRKRSGRYGKVYSDILTDTKLAALMQGRGGHRAFTAWALGLALTAQQLTDGVIQPADLRTLYATPADATALVNVGLWEVFDGGWRYVRYAEGGNMTKAQVAHLKREGEISQCGRWMRDKDQSCQCGAHNATGERIADLVGDL